MSFDQCQSPEPKHFVTAAPNADLFNQLHQIQNADRDGGIAGKGPTYDDHLHITNDAERCILCSRCIRFMKEVAKDDVLGIVDRGSFTTIACHPERMLDNNYSLNTVDICPVGALTSSGFPLQDARLVPQGNQDAST